MSEKPGGRHILYGFLLAGNWNLCVRFSKRGEELFPSDGFTVFACEIHPCSHCYERIDIFLNSVFTEQRNQFPLQPSRVLCSTYQRLKERPFAVQPVLS